MKNLRIQISSVLLAILVVPVIMTYQIFPADTNYLQFALIFLGLLLNIIVDVLPLSEKKYKVTKYILFWFVILLSVGGAFTTAIIIRHKVAPVFQIHDIILQLEAAIQFFIHGVNPWAATYFNTFMASWHYSDTAINPALYHFVMMPFYLIFSLPFYLVSNHTLGYFDGRIPLFFLYFVMLILPFKLVKNLEQKLIFATILALNPAMFAYTLEGRSDIFMTAFLFIGLLLLTKKRFSLAGIFIGLAFCIKQSVWPMFPLYAGFIYFNSSRNILLTIKRLLSFFTIFIGITIPFFLWNPKAFVDSTILYLAGNTEHSYPISGYGFGMLLHQFGFIKDLNSAYPFLLWQIVIVVPSLIVLFYYLKKQHNVRMLILTYGVLTFIYWYFSRYFNNSHLGYLTLIFLAAYFWPVNDGKNSV